MPQADQTWGAAGGGTPLTPGGEGAKRPETIYCGTIRQILQIESDRFYLLCSAAVQHKFVHLVRFGPVSCLCAVPAI